MSTAAPVSNVVLVHGGFVDGSGWQGGYNILTRRGYHVSVVQNPTLSLATPVGYGEKSANVTLRKLFEKYQPDIHLIANGAQDRRKFFEAAALADVHHQRCAAR